MGNLIVALQSSHAILTPLLSEYKYSFLRQQKRVFRNELLKALESAVLKKSSTRGFNIMRQKTNERKILFIELEFAAGLLKSVACIPL